MPYLNDVIWNDSAWPALESLNHAVSCDVCVVGLGGSGLHAIHELLQHGVDVIGIDAGMVGSGAAGSNGGFILKHSVGNYPRKTEVDVPLTYADYYFIEAMVRYKNKSQYGSVLEK